MKIIDKINDCIGKDKPFFSFEYFPPKTEAGVQNLYDRLDRMAQLEPLFVDVTWGAGGSTSDLTFEICANTQNFVGLEVQMHLTCTNMPKKLIDDALSKAKEAGIQNIVALRGDPPAGQENWTAVEGGFSYAVDLVRYIRKEYGDYFSIAVAGYPEGHLEATSFDDDMKYLKEKIDAGADYILTQLFYDVDVFFKFVDRCRDMGITCPIVPGIMPILNYGSFSRMTSFCKTLVPKEIQNLLDPVKDDDEKVKAIGVQIGVDMCRRLLASGKVPGLHMYTLNLEKGVVKILEGLSLINMDSVAKRMLPWRKPPTGKREKEEVRPIFWANRPKSYLSRTSSWDEYPNGRWGDSRSPAFGELVDYHITQLYSCKATERKNMWGKEPKKAQDIYDVFAKFIDGSISRLPWCIGPLSLESIQIKKELMNLNSSGFLTINSQPVVHSAPSDDQYVGWGGPGGYVYQKAYMEFFASPIHLKVLEEVVRDFPSITFMAANVKGDRRANVSMDNVNAVTWGVFPGKEIVQPTIVDSKSFMVWRTEAFSLWKSQWGQLYTEGSESKNVINEIHDTYYLINVVDNDFVRGSIMNFFSKVVEKLKAQCQE